MKITLTLCWHAKLNTTYNVETWLNTVSIPQYPLNVVVEMFMEQTSLQGSDTSVQTQEIQGMKMKDGEGVG